MNDIIRFIVAALIFMAGPVATFFITLNMPDDVAAYGVLIGMVLGFVSGVLAAVFWDVTGDDW